MQHSEMLIEEVVASLEKIVGGINSRLDALEAETGVEILNGYDEDRNDYRHNQLAKIGGGGVAQWNAQKKEWRVIVNTVESVKIEGETLVIEKSDGTISKSAIIKTTRAKPVKVTTA